jgi:hypothetical protein
MALRFCVAGNGYRPEPGNRTLIGVSLFAHELPFYYRALSNSDNLVAYVAKDLGLRLELQAFCTLHVAADFAINDHVGNGDITVYLSLFTEDQQATAGTLQRDITRNLAIDPESAREADVSFQLDLRTDQGIDRSAQFVIKLFRQRT